MAKDILMNHVGFLPWSAKHFVIANPPDKRVTLNGTLDINLLSGFRTSRRL